MLNWGVQIKNLIFYWKKLQEDHKIKPQVCIMMPILEGLDGVKKMSKSLGNYISISDDPNDMFGKVMSISDELMWRYYELLSFKTQMKKALKEELLKDKMNPRDVKIELAFELIERFHGKKLPIKLKIILYPDFKIKILQRIYLFRY